MSYTRPAAPGALERVEAFCNSARFLYGEDAFATLEGTRAWLHDGGWLAGTGLVDEAARDSLVAVREAIRRHIEGDASARVRGTLNEHARRVLSPPQWGPAGPPELLQTGTDEIGALVGGLLATLATEELAGRRGRLKVCRAPECRWLFYDRSPANNSVWCSMSICGARHKMRSYRTRRDDPAAQ
ncbi:putative RNA-binding Zn ribbon-like protein [Murinocardiopsis flavida]|uniref:Putative RNA-binding Zn ribbon-like protein n=1 Tax=Murinocardiopsis flavida TaxID=645275 RepID=A0A2P8CF52_9ACTN|nr:CGNR zinc finger domain-containing protein [Murinocardiopsis flavida]PSK83576.1 putative RNA-binding Zn ribbon-like protein [Murinocardiopsis flavida]